MKYIIITIMCLMLFSSVCYANFDKCPAYAIEWWLRNQGKFEGAKINTMQQLDGSYLITHWEANGVQQPKDDDIRQIISDYEKQPQPLTLEQRVSTLETKVK